eukprot:2102345-Karenia_brevis.AAC.1
MGRVSRRHGCGRCALGRACPVSSKADVHLGGPQGKIQRDEGAIAAVGARADGRADRKSRASAQH